MQLWLFFCIDNCCRCFHLALSFLIGFILTSVTKTIDPQSIRWFIKVAHERTKKIAVSRHRGWMILWLGFKVAAIISKKAWECPLWHTPIITLLTLHFNSIKEFHIIVREMASLKNYKTTVSFIYTNKNNKVFSMNNWKLKIFVNCVILCK